MEKEDKIIDSKDLEFLAAKSSDFIEKQLNSYRHKHSNAGSIITIIALFIPFFLNGLDNSYLLIKICSIIPVVILLWAIILLINILKTKSLDQGFHINKFDELINKSFEEILLYEIGANKSSFEDNQKIIDKTNVNYFVAIKLTVIAIMFSTSLLLLNKFYKPVESDKITKVEIIKPKTMSVQNNNDDPKPDRTLPFVPPVDRTNLNDPFPSPSTNTTGSDSE